MIADARPDAEHQSSGTDAARTENGFRAEIVEAAGEQVLLLRGLGELDLNTRSEARGAIARALRTDQCPRPDLWVAPAEMVIDLRATTYLAATVVAALVAEARRTPTRNRARLVIARTGIAARVVATLRLAEIFDVFDDLDDALTPSPP